MSAEASLAPDTSAPRRRPPPRPYADSDLAVAPVVDALVASFWQRAGALRSAAEDDARMIVASAHARADRELESARAAGAGAAERAAAVQLAAARREARGLVLAAHRRAYEALRSRAVEILGQRLLSAEWRPVLDSLGRLVSDRVGAPAAQLEERPGTWRLFAERGSERAELDPAALVDPLLGAFLPQLVAP